MKINLLIATSDNDYNEHLSGYLSNKYKEAFFVSVCSAPEKLQEMLASVDYDVALLEAPLVTDADLSSVRLPLLLWDEGDPDANVRDGFTRLVKYQRISSIVSCILEHYAAVAAEECGPDAGRAYITAVWSPAGGVGKTTVALAHAIMASAGGKNTLYLNMEHFSSGPAYFSDEGRSISSVFEMLEKNEGNLKMLIQAVLRKDANTGVSFFRHPENFDDMNILTPEDVAALINACAGVAEALLVDLSNVCDDRTRQVFKLADKVLIVTDQTSASQIKLRQFTSQRGVYEQIKAKAVIVANRGAEFTEPGFDEIITLPAIQSASSAAVTKTLSGYELSRVYV